MSQTPRQPREAKTFGVGSVLGEKAKVYYSHLSSMDHMGRVSDLFNALLKKEAPDPLKLRLILLLTGFQASLVKSKEAKAAQSILVECGSDQEQVAIGVSFVYPGFGKEALAGLPERIRSQQAGNIFERILFWCADLGDRCYFRIQPQQQRVEIVTVFDFASKGLRLNEPISQRLAFILIGDEKKEQPKVAEYTELGDTDYAKLLEQKNPLEKILAPTTGDFIAKSVKVEDFKKLVEDSQKNDDFTKTFGADEKTDPGEYQVRSYGSMGEAFVPTDIDKEVYEEIPEAKETDEELKDSENALDDVVSIVRGQTLDAVLKGSSSKEQAKAAVDGLFKELIGEKSRLVDTAKRVNTLLKKKALEFKNKERGWNEDLRRKDEEVKQRLAAYNHMKEQLTKAHVQLTELKRVATLSNNDEIFKKKYEETRAEFAELKREHTLATRKVAEMTKQVNELQNTSKGPDAADLGQLAAAQQKAAQALRQVEDFKRINQQLMAKMTDLEKKRGNGNSQLEEFRAKFAKANILAQDKTKEAERHKQKLAEVMAEKEKLAKDLLELKTLLRAKASKAA